MLYDKNGIPFKVGDVVKVFHFTAALRRKRYYMYKQIVGIRTWDNGFQAMEFSHLDMTNYVYYIGMDKGLLLDYEIIQSVKDSHETRGRVVPMVEVY